MRFDYAVDEQMEHMWTSFYPAAADRAADFRAALRAALDGRPVTTADLQHFFVTQMRSPPEGALAAAGTVADELRQREADAAAESRRLAEQAAKEKEEADGEEKEHGEDASAGEPARHIHLHLHADDRVVVEVAEEGTAAQANGKKLNGTNGTNGHAHSSDSEEE